jgi:hypothetical protein
MSGPRLQNGAGGHRVKAPGFDLPFWAFTRLAQVQEPGSTGGEAGGGRGLGTMTKKPVRRYTVDGKRMTPDDLRRLHEYLIEMETIAIISDEMRVVVESEWPELAHKLPPK